MVLARLTIAALLLAHGLGCGGSQQRGAEPEQPAPGPASSTAVVEEAGRGPGYNPCDHLDPQVFDPVVPSERTDLTPAQQDELRRQQAARRQVLYDCFERAMKETPAPEPRTAPP
jgi:hypothetical protein